MCARKDVRRWLPAVHWSVVASLLSMVALLSMVGGCQLAAEGQNSEGVRLYEAGQYTAALQKFQQARTSAPNDADSYYNMAASYHQMAKPRRNVEMFGQAEALYNQCLDIDSDHVECHRGLGVLLIETDRPSAAFRLMKNWSTDNPKSADARVELARLYQEFGDPETAQAELQSALAVDQNNYRAWAALGALREQSGDLAQALDNYQRSYNLNAFQPAVATKIASLTQATGGGSATPGGTRTVTPARPIMR